MMVKSVLAAYATFKELYNSNRYSNPYQILGEFIKYIISTKALYNFTTAEIQIKLREEFGFDLPIAVIRTATKGIEGISVRNGIFSIKRDQLTNNNEFLQYKSSSEEKAVNILLELNSYAEKECNKNAVNKERLSDSFVAYLLDETVDENDENIISRFVVDKGSDAFFNSLMTEIRDGSILYTGLSYNISEYGSLKNPITLYLDTEILFDITGLNGQIYKSLGLDFIELINLANRNGTRIKLRYFSDVKQDVDNYFLRAEQLVSGKNELVPRLAMKEIVTGCNNISDVRDKLTHFYMTLSSYSILLDEKKNYYTQADEKYNLEGVALDGFSVNDEYYNEGLKYCSHINKLRKGNQSDDYFGCQYLFVSDTSRVLKVSRQLTQIDCGKSGLALCDYAVSLSKITNLLWLKLNRGFGNQVFPKNLDVAIKARTILSGYIQQGVLNTYRELKKRYDQGSLTDEEAAICVLALREKITAPEMLNENSIDEAFSFDNDYLDNYAESIEKSKRLLAERDNTIKLLALT